LIHFFPKPDLTPDLAHLATLFWAIIVHIWAIGHGQVYKTSLRTLTAQRLESARTERKEQQYASNYRRGFWNRWLTALWIGNPDEELLRGFEVAITLKAARRIWDKEIATVAKISYVRQAVQSRDKASGIIINRRLISGVASCQHLKP
jgi:hypothetical protein